MTYLVGADVASQAQTQPQPQPVALAPAAVSAITVSASPFVFVNSGTSPVSVLVSGGTVSLLEFSRDGTTFYPVGLLAGVVPLDPNDSLRATYMVAPTLTLIPH